MNKVVCNLCGTSYPENAAQCPICGYARTADSAAETSKSSYTYVKGGRFSKANVKKRNQAAGIVVEAPVQAAKKENKANKKSGAGLTVVIIVLLLAIVAVLGFIAIRFFVPNNNPGDVKLPIAQEQDDLLSDETADEPEEEQVETEPDLSCTAITVEQNAIELSAIGAEAKLTVVVEPADTTDQITFTSSDEAVVTVDADGTVHAVSEGSAVITVSCGSVSAQCTVTCTVPATEPEVKLTLNRKEITFNVEGQSWLLYDGEIPVSDIVWTSDDNNVVTIENGKAVAVGNGDTTVYGVYEGKTASCIIHCKLDEDASGESGGISEAGGESGRTYKLYNPTGFADDVTLNVGEKFTLKLVDENTEAVTDAQWQIEDENVCSYTDSVVEALAEGTTKITATFEGVTYTCLVRVI